MSSIVSKQEDELQIGYYVGISLFDNKNWYTNNINSLFGRALKKLKVVYEIKKVSINFWKCFILLEKRKLI